VKDVTFKPTSASKFIKFNKNSLQFEIKKSDKEESLKLVKITVSIETTTDSNNIRTNEATFNLNI
jgi:hypothetical protein